MNTIEELTHENTTINDSAYLLAKEFDSDFKEAHDTYNGLSKASDGNIYYVLSSEKHNIGGKMYKYLPAKNIVMPVGDLTSFCGEENKKAIVQGKSHVDFYEMNGKLYFSTHVGFYQLINGMDRLPVVAPDGYDLYPGGHILSYDLESGVVEDLAIIPNGEGVVSMVMDTERGNIFAISWPSGHFYFFNVQTGTFKDLGLVNAQGEAGEPGNDFRSLCRSLFVDARDGKVYYSTAEGDIFSYTPFDDSVNKLSDVNLRKDYFGKYDFKYPGSMCYNWRKIFWHKKDNKAYGIHGNSGYLFSFDPLENKIELIERLTSLPSKKSGMFDQFSYGYLGFEFNADKETIFYLTGGPVYENGIRVEGVAAIAKGAARGIENLHLITYHLPTRTYTDHGPVFYENGERPLYVNSIAVGDDGNIYTLARINRNGKVITDLISIKNPVK